MTSWVWVVIAIVVVIAIALVAVAARNRRTAELRDRFGPEYDRTLENNDGRRAAEAELLARQKQRAQVDVKPLPEAARLRFASEWRDVQERFVDQPTQAVPAADALVTRVMEARGYPMNDFDAQADLVSVDHPETVENYRLAHAVGQRPQSQQTSTEDLREALLRYRSLFDELLLPEGNGATGVTAGYTRPASANGGRHRGTVAPETLDASGASATGQPADTEGDAPGPAASDPDYHDQQIGQ